MLNPVARELPALLPLPVATLAEPLSIVNLGAGPAPASPLLHCVCITLYNEPLRLLQESLFSVLTALVAERRRLASVQHDLVGIVADGIEALAPDTRQFLDRHFELEDFQPAGEHVFLLERSAVGLMTGCDDESLQVLLIIKARNQGKLHSHALLFEAVCRPRCPTFVYQIDVGSVLRVDAISQVMKHFEHHPEHGAVATRGAPAAPTADEGLLSTWQFMDYRAQLNLFWPAEVMTGHLTVVPGQFCALRWSALLQTDAAGRDVVQRYLRGLQPTDALECTMFLAEDRVVGNELWATRPDGRAVGYAYAARAVIDKCESLPELMRQRRRWNNGANAGRWWLITESLRALASSRPWREQGPQLAGLLWQLALLIQQCLAPTLLINSLVLAAAVLGHYATQTESLWLPGAAISALATYGVFSASPVRGWRTRAWRDICLWIYWLLLMLMAARVLSAGDLCLLGGSLCLVAVFVAAMNTSDRSMTWRRLPEYLTVGPWLQLLLLSYSLWRLSDCSWGTKGLRHNPLSTPLRQQLRRARQITLCLWIGVNAALLLFTPWLSQSANAQLNPLLVGLVGLLSLAAALAGGFHLQRWLDRRPARTVATTRLSSEAKP